MFNDFIWLDELGNELFFEDWLEVNEDQLNIVFAESGADREFDFSYNQSASDIYFNLLEGEGKIWLDSNGDMLIG